MYKFAAASENEPIVFGAGRPGYSDAQINEWLQFMQDKGIKGVCCLLSNAQLNQYSNLLGTYQQVFGDRQVCWAPIEDFALADSEVLIHQILPFFAAANQKNERVVVHCAGGIGRTGQVLAAWLIAARGFSKKAAIREVKATGRNPYEAVIAAPFKGRNPWKVFAELNTLLDACGRFQESQPGFLSDTRK
ncbi:MAG: dual specificity protein phosphatase family protein [Cyanobacteria bacterium J06627_28]